MPDEEVQGSAILVGDDPIVSKYMFTFPLSSGLVATFNINTDIATPRFSANNTLKLIVDNEDHLQGYVPFSGVIGKGKIKVTMKNGIRVQGVIEGGPKIVQSIAGFGTWLRS